MNLTKICLFSILFFMVTACAPNWYTKEKINGTSVFSQYGLKQLQKRCGPSGQEGAVWGGCIELGSHYEDGSNVHKDYIKAMHWYKAGCSLNRYQCTSAAELYLNEQYSERDKEQAKHYFKMACDDGSDEGCRGYGELEHGSANAEYMKKITKKEGVLVTEKGLKYERLKSGVGELVEERISIAEFHIKGTLINGDEFYSSYQEGRPERHLLNDFPIPMLGEGLKLMRAGDVFRFYLEPNLETKLSLGSVFGSGKAVDDKVLIYDVEMISVSPSQWQFHKTDWEER